MGYAKLLRQSSTVGWKDFTKGEDDTRKEESLLRVKSRKENPFLGKGSEQ